jgi:hypothetical protein
MEWLQPDLNGAAAWPLVAYLPAIAGLVSGLLLLLAGHRVLKPVTLVLGASAGGLLAVTTLTSVFEGRTYECPPALAALAVGLVVGGIVALALFRAALALGGAATFAAMGVLIAGVLMPQTRPTAADRIEAGVQEQVILVSHALDPVPGLTSPESAVDIAATAGRHAADYAGLAWEMIPEEGQARLILVALGAGVLGLVAGAFLPRQTQTLVTALLGGAVVLASLTWLVGELGVSNAGLMEHGFMGWLLIWCGVSAVGIGAQVCTRRPAPKSA